MLEKIKNQSKKNLILVLGLVALFVNDYLGKPMSQETLLIALGYASTWLVARGIADNGAGGSVRNANAIYKKGKEIYEMMKAPGSAGVMVTKQPD